MIHDGSRQFMLHSPKIIGNEIALWEWITPDQFEPFHRASTKYSCNRFSHVDDNDLGSLPGAVPEHDPARRSPGKAAGRRFQLGRQSSVSARLNPQSNSNAHRLGTKPLDLSAVDGSSLIEFALPTWLITSSWDDKSGSVRTRARLRSRWLSGLANLKRIRAEVVNHSIFCASPYSIPLLHTMGNVFHVDNQLY